MEPAFTLTKRIIFDAWECYRTNFGPLLGASLILLISARILFVLPYLFDPFHAVSILQLAALWILGSYFLFTLILFYDSDRDSILGPAKQALEHPDIMLKIVLAQLMSGAFNAVIVVILMTGWLAASFLISLFLNPLIGVLLFLVLLPPCAFILISLIFSLLLNAPFLVYEECELWASFTHSYSLARRRFYPLMLLSLFFILILSPAFFLAVPVVVFQSQPGQPVFETANFLASLWGALFAPFMMLCVPAAYFALLSTGEDGESTAPLSGGASA
ncbi:MAG: hypothetical protein GC154_04960 [bacterium]|nr:hypothetical protein [bacterium]